ncbi:MAG: tyrosine-type recombinase/integrase [Armatimonadota bacterium]
MLDGEVRSLSKRTLEERQAFADKFVWWLRHTERDACGKAELRAFLAYVNRGHEDPAGRWGNPRNTRPVKAGTVAAYYRLLHTFFGFVVQEGELEASPMESLTAPVVRRDQIQPFSEEQVNALLTAAGKSSDPKRDEAILLFLLDTGARVSETCRIRTQDLDLTGRRVRVVGKGGKERTLPFGRKVAKAFFAYLRDMPKEPEDALFASNRGREAGEPLTRDGMHALIARLGGRANIDTVRCSPHTFRHTFAISFLRNGGNVFTLKELLGHTSLVMVNRYVALAQADIESQHRQFSPADRLKRK